MAPLAVLPVFFTLSGRRAVVAGNGEAAAWKAELLAAAGAEVRVFAPEPDEALAALAGQEPRVILLRRAWQPATLPGRRWPLPKATMQRPPLPSMPPPVPPVRPATSSTGPTIAISSSAPWSIARRWSSASRPRATAPVLGQAIRRRIEAILPADIGRWAAAARAFRGRLAEAVATPLRRRMIWSRFAERVFASRPVGGTPDLDDLLADDRDEAGVTLVGAGPGGAGVPHLRRRARPAACRRHPL